VVAAVYSDANIEDKRNKRYACADPERSPAEAQFLTIFSGTVAGWSESRIGIRVARHYRCPSSEFDGLDT
jgi:hypothetical protein